MGRMTILVPLEGLIDLAAESERLEKQKRQAAADLEKTEQKLANPQFVANAPEAVVNEQRGRAEALEERLAQLDAQLARLKAMG